MGIPDKRNTQGRFMAKLHHEMTEERFQKDVISLQKVFSDTQ